MLNKKLLNTREVLHPGHPYRLRTELDLVCSAINVRAAQLRNDYRPQGCTVDPSVRGIKDLLGNNRGIQESQRVMTNLRIFSQKLALRHKSVNLIFKTLKINDLFYSSATKNYNQGVKLFLHKILSTGVVKDKSQHLDFYRYRLLGIVLLFLIANMLLILRRKQSAPITLQSLFRCATSQFHVTVYSRNALLCNRK